MNRGEKQRLARLAYSKRYPERALASRKKWYAKKRAALGYAGPWTCHNCGKTVKANGQGGHKTWCGRQIDEEAFWDRMERLPWSGCWIWMGPYLSTGYGAARMILDGKRKLLGTHRIAWILTHGPYPEGMFVLHRCDQPFCCNPAHLFLGTHDENMGDRHAKGRSARGEMVKRNKLTEAQAREILALKGTGPAKPIADRYGVGPGAITAIWRGMYWKHIQVAA